MERNPQIPGSLKTLFISLSCDKVGCFYSHILNSKMNDDEGVRGFNNGFGAFLES